MKIPAEREKKTGRTAIEAVTKPPVATLGQGLSEQALAELDQHISTLPVDVGRIRGTTLAGSELDYAEITSDSSAVAATTEGTSVAVITGNSVSYDGGRVRIEFFAPLLDSSTSSQDTTAVLYVDTTVIGKAFVSPSNGNQRFPAKVETFYTPDLGAHTFAVNLFVSAGSTTVKAGAGGPGTYLPAFLRVTAA